MGLPLEPNIIIHHKKVRAAVGFNHWSTLTIGECALSRNGVFLKESQTPPWPPSPALLLQVPPGRWDPSGMAGWTLHQVPPQQGAHLSHTRPHRDPRQPCLVAQNTRLGEVTAVSALALARAPSAANTLQDRMFLPGKLPTASPGRLFS